MYIDYQLVVVFLFHGGGVELGQVKSIRSQANKQAGRCAAFTLCSMPLSASYKSTFDFDGV